MGYTPSIKPVVTAWGAQPPSYFRFFGCRSVFTKKKKDTVQTGENWETPDARLISDSEASVLCAPLAPLFCVVQMRDTECARAILMKTVEMVRCLHLSMRGPHPSRYHTCTLRRPGGYARSGRLSEHGTQLLMTLRKLIESETERSAGQKADHIRSRARPREGLYETGSKAQVSTHFR